jgi:hypothetical protein
VTSELLRLAQSMCQVKAQTDEPVLWLLTVPVESVRWHDKTGLKLRGVLDAAAAAVWTAATFGAAAQPAHSLGRSESMSGQGRTAFRTENPDDRVDSQF